MISSNHKKTLWHIMLVPLLMALSASSAWAVYATASGTTLKLQDDQGNALASQTLTLEVNGQAVDVMTDANGEVRVCREEERKEDDQACGLYLKDGDRIGYGTTALTWTGSGFSGGGWSTRTKVLVGAGVALGAWGIYELAKDDDDDNQSSVPPSPPPSDGGGSGDTGTSPPVSSVSDCADKIYTVNFGGFSSQGGCPNLFNQLECALITRGGTQKEWNCGPNLWNVTGQLNLGNGQFIGTGTNAYSIVPNAPYQFNAVFTPSGNTCNVNGSLQVGPPLTTASERCFWGAVSGNAQIGGP